MLRKVRPRLSTNWYLHILLLQNLTHFTMNRFILISLKKKIVEWLYLKHGCSCTLIVVCIKLLFNPLQGEWATYVIETALSLCCPDLNRKLFWSNLKRNFILECRIWKTYCTYLFLINSVWKQTLKVILKWSNKYVDKVQKMIK
jgi:hypothetical protein